MSQPLDATSSPTTGWHTILGANGVIGRELSRELVRQGRAVRQVSRHPLAVHAGDDLRSADLLDARATANAVAGSEVAYLVAGLAYNTTVWQTQWPRVMRNVMDACQRHGVRLVFFDNVYAYGRVAGAMTEETPFNPCSRKGEVRAAVATMVVDAMRRGELQALIARSADFYGPSATNSLLHAVLFERLRAKKTPQWIGNPAAIHTFTYTPDAGRALAALGQMPSAFGQTWHLPTSGEPMTGERIVRLSCELAGQPFRLQVMPNWLLRPVGWFVPTIRENNELMYQLNEDYRFDSSKIERALALSPTAWQEGLAAVLASTR